ncbi:MAG: hypothetical protein QXS27_07335, partial [Candidatus Jordarchaeaceae archaeon]
IANPRAREPLKKNRWFVRIGGFSLRLISLSNRNWDKKNTQERTIIAKAPLAIAVSLKRTGHVSGKK